MVQLDRITGAQIHLRRWKAAIQRATLASGRFDDQVRGQQAVILQGQAESIRPALVPPVGAKCFHQPAQPGWIRAQQQFLAQRYRRFSRLADKGVL